MRKAQAAMEFLMTYGWAILVVIAAIAALAYFGVLSPAKVLPETATGFTGFTPIGQPVAYKADQKIALTMANNLGTKVNLTQATFSSTDASCTSGYFCDKGVTNCSNSWKEVENNEQFTVVLSSCTFNADRVKGELEISYYNPNTGLTQKIKGTVQVVPK